MRHGGGVAPDGVRRLRRLDGGGREIFRRHPERHAVRRRVKYVAAFHAFDAHPHGAARRLQADGGADTHRRGCDRRCLFCRGCPGRGAVRRDPADAAHGAATQAALNESIRDIAHILGCEQRLISGGGDGSFFDARLCCLGRAFDGKPLGCFLCNPFGQPTQRLAPGVAGQAADPRNRTDHVQRHDRHACSGGIFRGLLARHAFIQQRRIQGPKILGRRRKGGTSHAAAESTVFAFRRATADISANGASDEGRYGGTSAGPGAFRDISTDVAKVFYVRIRRNLSLVLNA